MYYETIRDIKKDKSLTEVQKKKLIEDKFIEREKAEQIIKKWYNGFKKGKGK